MTGQRIQTLKLNPRGVNQDIPPGQLDPNLLSGALNAESFDIGIQRSGGLTEAFQGTLFPPEHIAFNKDANLFYWLYASSAGVGVTDGTTHFDL